MRYSIILFFILSFFSNSYSQVTHQDSIVNTDKGLVNFNKFRIGDTKLYFLLGADTPFKSDLAKPNLHFCYFEDFLLFAITGIPTTNIGYLTYSEVEKEMISEKLKYAQESEVIGSPKGSIFKKQDRYVTKVSYVKKDISGGYTFNMFYTLYGKSDWIVFSIKAGVEDLDGLKALLDDTVESIGDSLLENNMLIIDGFYSSKYK